MNETKKYLGQHWLNDYATLESIVAAANIMPNDDVLEIGPGHGALTEVLAAKGASVLALEFDQDLIKGLEFKFNTSQVKIEQGDVRTFNFTSMPKKYKIVANIPYYLTSHLIRSISETTNPPKLAVLLIQKEVAQRLCAEPGKMGILSVTAQFYFECSLNVEVSAKLFTPPPKVDSQVVVLRLRQKQLYEGIDEQSFFKLVKAGFSEKRKTLRNSLSGGLAISKVDSVSLLERAGIEKTLRAQQLSLDDWHKLYIEYNKGQ